MTTPKPPSALEQLRRLAVQHNNEQQQVHVSPASSSLPSQAYPQMLTLLQCQQAAATPDLLMASFQKQLLGAYLQTPLLAVNPLLYSNPAYLQALMAQASANVVPVSSVDKVQMGKVEEVWSHSSQSSNRRRVKGEIYIVKGVRKKWDGKRFARCCIFPECPKLAQGATKYCKAHGGGSRCTVNNCKRAARGGSYFCANHSSFRKKKGVSKSRCVPKQENM